MLQTGLLQKVRDVCERDENLLAALMYGSFAKQSGDQFSDIEFVFFFRDEALETIDQQTWLSQIAPVEICYVNEFGVTDVIFDNLIRGEFHFDKISDVAVVSSWAGSDTFPSLETTLIVDKVYQLTPHLQTLISPEPLGVSAEQVQFFVNSFCNWWLFGVNLVKRGDDAHALNILWMVQRNLLALVRVQEGAIENLPSPSKNLALDLSAEAYAYYQTCTSDLQAEHLKAAYQAALDWGIECIHNLEQHYEALWPQGFDEKLKRYISER